MRECRVWHPFSQETLVERGAHKTESPCPGPELQRSDTVWLGWFWASLFPGCELPLVHLATLCKLDD